MAVRAKKLQPAKQAAIEEAKKILGEYEDFIFVDYRGLTVDDGWECPSCLCVRGGCGAIPRRS